MRSKLLTKMLHDNYDTNMHSIQVMESILVQAAKIAGSVTYHIHELEPNCFATPTRLWTTSFLILKKKNNNTNGHSR